MKLKIFGIFVCMLLVTSVFTIEINAEEDLYIKQKVESINFSEPNIINEDQYITLELKESTSLFIEAGKPILPVYTKVFKFPFGTKIKSINCYPLEINQKAVPKKIRPSTEPVLIENMNKDIEVCITTDNTIYNSNDFFPNEWYEYKVGCGLDGPNRVIFLSIRCYPIQYSPGLNLVRYSSRLVLTIEYIEPLKHVVFPDEYEMMIIAPLVFSEDLQPLVDYKNDGLIATKLVTLNDIYSGTYFPATGRDDQEKIKYFIKDAIENWDIIYVLLAGGANKIPIRLSYVQDGKEESIISDLYYADIYDQYGSFCSWDSNNNDIFGEFNYQGRTDFVDLYPDVHLGRLNLRSIKEVSGVINKIITYETTGAYMEDWFKKIITCGGDTFDDGAGYCEGEAVNQAVINLLSDFDFEKIWATNGKLESISNIVNAVMDGAGFLYFSGHGTYQNWFTYPQNDFENGIPRPFGYTYLHVEQLENEVMLPIVYIGGCSNLKFFEDISFGWSFIKNPNGGSISTYGYNALGWGLLGPSYLFGLVGGMEQSFFKAYKINNAETAGELWSETLNNYITDYFSGGAYNIKTVEELEPFCDPSLRIVKISDKPNKPNKPDGPTLGVINTEYTYETSTTDPNGDMIKYCIDWGDGTISWSAWVESGEPVSLNHIWEKPGYHEIKVKARDEYGLDSEWSESTTMHITGAILDVQKISGGFLKVRAEIKNIGDVDIVGVNWSISVVGGIFGWINVFTEGKIETPLEIDQQATVTSKNIFGLGRVNIIITASVSDSNVAKKTVSGFVFGPIILIL